MSSKKHISNGFHQLKSIFPDERFNHLQIDTMTVGQRIQAARENKGMTRTELATAISTVYHRINRWENDLMVPTEETIELIAQVLDIDPLWLQYGYTLVEPDFIYSQYSNETENELLEDHVSIQARSLALHKNQNTLATLPWSSQHELLAVLNGYQFISACLKEGLPVSKESEKILIQKGIIPERHIDNELQLIQNAAETIRKYQEYLETETATSKVESADA